VNKQTLIYGIGNPGREDDGLGFEFVINLPDGLQYEKCHCYQLNIEDAELFSKYKKIILVDAAKNIECDFEYKKVEAKPESFFSTHGITMEAVLAMTQDIYGKSPETYLLALKGHSYQIKLGISEQAKTSLANAIEWFRKNPSVLLPN
jgi:hydrogenase maturation protease